MKGIVMIDKFQSIFLAQNVICKGFQEVIGINVLHIKTLIQSHLVNAPADS